MKKWALLMSPEGDANAGAAPTTESKAAQQPPTPANPPQAETEGDQFDDLGYKVTKPEATKDTETKGDKKPEQTETPPQSEEIKDPVSGYDKAPEPVKEETPPAAEPVKEETAPTVEVNVDGLPESVATALKKTVTDMKLSKEAAEALVSIKKKEIENLNSLQKAMEKEAADTKLKWYNELKSDPVFGGDKYAFNVNRVEKVLNEFMPDTKKVLTERKSMLPPYVMRGLAKIADHLYGTESLVQGGAKEPSPDDKKVDDVLSFYT